jgi:hypothetical protein
MPDLIYFLSKFCFLFPFFLSFFPTKNSLTIMHILFIFHDINSALDLLLRVKKLTIIFLDNILLFL